MKPSDCNGGYARADEGFIILGVMRIFNTYLVYDGVQVA